MPKPDGKRSQASGDASLTLINKALLCATATVEAATKRKPVRLGTSFVVLSVLVSSELG